MKTANLDSFTSTYRADTIRAGWLAYAGLNTAVSIINEHRQSLGTFQQWQQYQSDLQQVELEHGFFSVYIIDEASKLNVNTVTVEQLMELPSMTQETAQSIIAWRQQANEARSGTQVGYYRSLAVPYQMRQGPYQTIRELLLIRGVTEELFYGSYTEQRLSLADIQSAADGLIETKDRQKGWIHYLSCYSRSLNADADGKDRVNINSASSNEMESRLGISSQQAQWIIENRDHDSIADILAQNESEQRIGRKKFIQLADLITTSNDDAIEGQVNINTACRTVLAAIFNGSNSVSRADRIINHRRINGPFANIGRLLELELLDVEQFKNIAKYITVRSNVFGVYVCADMQPHAPGRKWLTEAVVDRGRDKETILYIHHGVTNWTINTIPQ